MLSNTLYDEVQILPVLINQLLIMAKHFSSGKFLRQRKARTRWGCRPSSGVAVSVRRPWTPRLFRIITLITERSVPLRRTEVRFSASFRRLCWVFPDIYRRLVIKNHRVTSSTNSRYYWVWRRIPISDFIFSNSNSAFQLPFVRLRLLFNFDIALAD